MKNIIHTFLFLSFFQIAITNAGTDHNHEHEEAITTKEVALLASKHIERLIKAGKIDLSWKPLNINSIEQKTFSHHPEWVVTLKNSEIGDISKQRLYLFFSLGGRYLAANYTGE